MSVMTGEEITKDWGERCAEPSADCSTCQMWAMHDENTRLREEVADLAEKRISGLRAVGVLHDEFMAERKKSESPADRMVGDNQPIAHVSEWTAKQLRSGHDGDYHLTIKDGQVALYTAPPATDLLVGSEHEFFAAVKRFRRAYVNLMETGRDRIVSLGGSCDPVDVMEAGDPELRLIDAVLASVEVQNG